jgi:hypothetical protein
MKQLLDSCKVAIKLSRARRSKPAEQAMERLQLEVDRIERWEARDRVFAALERLRSVASDPKPEISGAVEGRMTSILIHDPSHADYFVGGFDDKGAYIHCEVCGEILARFSATMGEADDEWHKDQLEKIKPHMGHLGQLEVSWYGVINDIRSITVECTACDCVVTEIYNDGGRSGSCPHCNVSLTKGDDGFDHCPKCNSSFMKSV